MRSHRGRFELNALTAIALLLATRSVGAQRLFRAGVQTRAVYPIAEIGAGDYDNDGRPDVITTSPRVFVFHGEEGGFTSGVDLRLAGQAAIGDFDLDGRADVVVGQENGWVTVSHGPGTRLFASARGTTTTRVRFVEIADVTGDGFPDIVSSNLSSGLDILVNTGSSTFPEIEHRGHAAVRGCANVAVGDFLGRGVPSVVLQLPGEIRHYAVDELGHLADPIVSPIPEELRDIAAADVFPGGPLDLVGVTAAGSVYSLRSLGDGFFEAVFTGGVGPIDPRPEICGSERVISLADLDGDGRTDVIVNRMGQDARDLHVLTRLADGVSGLQLDFDVGVPFLSTVVLDVDRDGILDLVVPRADFPAIVVFHGHGRGLLEVPTTLPSELAPLDVLAIDVDNDGARDLVALGSTGLSVAMADGTGLFEEPRTVDLGERALQSFVAGDFDGDGDDDIAAADVSVAGTGTLLVLTLSRVRLPERVREIDVHESPTALAAADFDGDGIADLAIADRKHTALSIVLSPGAEPRGEDFELGDAQTGITTGDLNGDGSADILVSTKSSTIGLAGDGSGGFSEVFRLSGLPRSPAMAIADLDDDGASDIIAVSHQSLVVWSNVMGGPGAGRREIDIGKPIYDFELIRTPFGAYAVATSALAVATVPLRAGTGSITRHAIPAARGTAVDCADFNADGAPDCVVASLESSSISILSGRPRVELESFRRGDADDDGRVRLTDAVAILENLFRAGPAASCPDAADANDDGRVDLTDAVRILGRLFLGQPELPAPGIAVCGADESDDDLGACRSRCSE